MPSNRPAPPVVHFLIVCFAIVVCVSSIASADTTQEALYITCSTQVFRVIDINGDGDAMDANEVTVFASGLPQQIGAIECTSDELYITNGSHINIIVLADTNNDGDAMDLGEVSVFADLSPWMNDNPPLGLTIDAEGIMHTVDTAGAQLLRIVDLNNDGDAYDAGEILPVAINLDNAAAITRRDDGSILMATDISAVPVNLLLDRNGDGDFLDYAENISYGASFGPGVAIANIDEATSLLVRSSDSQILKLTDLNGDDDVLDFGEVLSYAHPATAIKAIAHSPTSGDYVAAGNSSGSIYRVVDLNGDGDAFDTGESILFASGLPIIRDIAIRSGGCIPGDVNADGRLDAGDVIDFVDVLLVVAPPPDLCRADLNNDGRIDGEDIAPFVGRMLE